MMSATWPLNWVKLSIGALAGAVIGGALGYSDLLFLAHLIDFERPRNFCGPPGDFVGYYLVGLNACCGVPAGVAAAIFLPCRGSLLARAVPGAVVGGYLGALLGTLDVVFLPQFLNLLNSDVMAAWRENRSVLVILNAAGATVASTLAGIWGSGRNRAGLT
jgi:hypothetical protein